jgi:hypothetical protein
MSKRAAKGTVADSKVAKQIAWATSPQEYLRDGALKAALRREIDQLVAAGYVRSPGSPPTTNYDCLTSTQAAVHAINDLESKSLARDLSILTDLQGFAKENRVITAVTLYAAASQGVHGIPGLTLNQDEVPIFRKTLWAKIFQEFVLGMEEAAALFVAICHREEGGIFDRYVNGWPDEAKDFFQTLINQPEVKLEILLRLPDRTVIQTRLLDQHNIGKQLDDLRDWLREGAKVFRADGGRLVSAMNNTKHGFVLVNDLKVLDPKCADGNTAGLNIVAGNTFARKDSNPEATYEVLTRALTASEPPEITLLRRLGKAQAWIIDLIRALHGVGEDLTLFGK